MQLKFLHSTPLAVEPLPVVPVTVTGRDYFLYWLPRLLKENFKFIAKKVYEKRVMVCTIILKNQLNLHLSIFLTTDSTPCFEDQGYL